MNKTMLSLTFFSLALCGCAGAGFGKAVRADIQKQMGTAEPMIQSCYASALQRDRKATGTMVVRVKTDPETGEFRRASVTSSEINDPQLDQCVLGTITKLKLDEPTKTSVEADYPIEFTPVQSESSDS